MYSIYILLKSKKNMDEDTLIQFIFLMSREKRSAFKARCAMNDTNMSDVLRDFIDSYISE